MRGCACRGDSAGFVHLKCVEELAVWKEVSKDPLALMSWVQCVQCKQNFQDGLGLEMKRRCWWRYRSGRHPDVLCYLSKKSLADLLEVNGQVDATQRYEEASKYTGGHWSLVLDLNLRRTEVLKRKFQMREALDLLNAIVPEAQECTAVDPSLYV